MSRADDIADIESGMLAMRGMNNAPITATKVLTSAETGFLLLDATAAGFQITLPPANRSMDVRVQRVDNSGNRLVIQAAGAEKILFHTHLRAEGYPFFVLMGAGDFWHLRSDGNGNWRVLHRLDSTPLGRPVMETTTAISPGGWGLYHGLIYNRSEWPWVWDHAQASGMLTTEALRTGKEGMWTSGDGALTFRSPEGRGEFFRVLDEARGINVGRVAGSFEAGQLESHAHSYNVGSVIVGTGAVATTAPKDTAGTVKTTNAAGGNETRPRNIAYPGRLKLI